MATQPTAPWLVQTRELLAVLAHDLRNPLTALRANAMMLAETLAAPHDTAEAAELLAELQASTAAVAALVESIDALGRLEALALAGEHEPWGMPGPCELTALLHQRLALREAGSATAYEALDVQLAPGPLRVGASEGLLVCLCDNLIAALRESPPRGARPRLSVHTDGAHHVLRAERPARPWPEAHECFARENQRSGTERGRPRGARGLALYLVSLAAQSVGGRAHIEPGGAALVVALPAA